MTNEEDKRENRKERKFAKKQDRSKFKKSVLKKHEAKRTEERDERVMNKKLFRGRVTTIFSNYLSVYSSGKVFTCTLRGVLKKEYMHTKNVVIVGDRVLFEKSSSTEGAICKIEERTTLLARVDKRTAGKQLIAANIDQIFITTSVKEPAFDIPYIDKAVIAALKGNMKPIIVINKIDLPLSPLVEEFIKAYKKMKFPLLMTSTKTGEGIEELKKKMKNKASVFAGLSGVGKSSLINALLHLDLPTGEISQKGQRGRHTTTTSSLIKLESGGFCIDTPGIQDFGIGELTKEELDWFFSDIAQIGAGCKFFNCSHSHEPGCVVKEACEKGKLSKLRLTSYVSLLKEI